MPTKGNLDIHDHNTIGCHTFIASTKGLYPQERDISQKHDLLQHDLSVFRLCSLERTTNLYVLAGFYLHTFERNFGQKSWWPHRLCDEGDRFRMMVIKKYAVVNILFLCPEFEENNHIC